MITDGDYTDDIALLTNTPTQAESLLYSVEWASGGIGLYVKADKTESSCALIKEISKTCEQIHLPRKQHLVYGKWHQYTTSEGIDHYQ